jgi:hypothetical protein
MELDKLVNTMLTHVVRLSEAYSENRKGRQEFIQKLDRGEFDGKLHKELPLVSRGN